MQRMSMLAAVVLLVVVGYRVAADEPKIAKGVIGTFQKLDDDTVTFLPAGAAKEAKTLKFDKKAVTFVNNKKVTIEEVMKEWKEGQKATFYVSADEIVGVMVLMGKK